MLTNKKILSFFYLSFLVTLFFLFFQAKNWPPNFLLLKKSNMVAHIERAVFRGKRLVTLLTKCHRSFPNVLRNSPAKLTYNMADEPHSNGEATCTRNSTLPEEFVPAECKFKMHTFSEMILDQKVHFQILKMTDSLYFWIGNSLEMDSLAVAMCTKFVSIFENSEIACKLEYI